MPDLPDSGRFDAGRTDGDRIAAELGALREAVEAAFTPPPIERFRPTRRRTRRRAGIIAVALTALGGLGGATLALADRGPDNAPRPAPTVIASIPPTPTAGVDTPPSAPAPATASAPATSETPTRSTPDIRTVEWTHVTIVLPPNPDDSNCPTGRITTNGAWTTVGSKKFFIGPALAHGDLTLDGSAEAVMGASCASGSENDGGDGSGQLLVVTWRDGTWTGLGYVGPRGQDYPTARISGQRLTAAINQRYGGAEQNRTYRWDGQRFIQVAGPTAFPSPPG